MHSTLTLEKLMVYRRFSGDIDGHARSRTEDSSGITDDDWRTIDELRQCLFLISTGRAAPEFTAKVEQRLAAVAPDEATRQAIRGLVV